MKVQSYWCHFDVGVGVIFKKVLLQIFLDDGQGTVR